MHLYDLVDVEEMTELARDGWLDEKFHPTEPLAILNYSKRAVPGAPCWEIPSLSHCRGLIYNTDNGEIVAQPFKKFWNYGQERADQIGLDEQVYAIDKLDGSLGILYVEPNSRMLSIATRGSFTSDQALHATDLLRNWYGWNTPTGSWHDADDETFLFEIIYPENRIVVDYGREDALHLLGSVDLEDGWVFTPAQAAAHLDWAGPRALSLGYNTLADALAAEPRENAEGMVISTAGGQKMVKLKQEDYLRLHRLVTGLSERRVWEQIVAEVPLAEILEALPDEFHPWTSSVYTRIKGEAIKFAERIRDDYHVIVDNIPFQTFTDDRQAKKAFAEAVSKTDHSWAYFRLYAGDGESIEKLYLEKHLQPAPNLTPYNH